jgi:AraC-like DNA-binding protein
VLAGGYDEAGDTGRHRVSPGDVIFHRAFESHLDQFHRPGAEVLVIPLPETWDGPSLGSIHDVDAIVRAAERDPEEALHLFATTVRERSAEPEDWPDLLAATLRADPSLSLEEWAGAAGLHPGSLSRGFAHVFGATPAAYRLAQRTRRAIDAIIGTEIPLSRVAADCGFADQAHMSRAVLSVAQTPPASLRRKRLPDPNRGS